METHRSNGTLSVSDVRELSAANAGSFRDEVCALLAPELKNIEIDLSQTSLVDSCGLGALVSVHNAAKGHVRMRLLNPFAVGAASLRTELAAPVSGAFVSALSVATAAGRCRSPRR